MNPSAANALLITGVYGSGKTSMAEEIADLLQHRHLPYGLIDLDYLSWFHAGDEDERAERRMLLRNLGAVVANYLDAGVRFLIVAGAIRDHAELEEIRAELGMPVKVVRLTAPLAEIERRLRSNVTTARHRDDLPTAAAWIEASTGVGIEDLTLPNDRPVRDVARAIMEWLGWA
jgi:adenylylsulfate kinase